MKKPKQNVLVNVLGIPVGVSKSKERMLTEDENNVVNIKKDFEEFDADKDYKAGDIVYYKDSIYKFILDHTGEWNEDDVERTNVYNILKEGISKNVVLPKIEFEILDKIDEKITYFVTNECKPLCFTALEDESVIKLSTGYNGYSPSLEPCPNDFEISTDGNNWEPYTINTMLTINKGEKVYFRNASDEIKQINNYEDDHGIGYYRFRSEKPYPTVNNSRFKVSGDITSLLTKNGNVDELPFERCFSYLFAGHMDDENVYIVDASELILPKTNNNSYNFLFRRHINLINPPALRFDELDSSFGIYRIVYQCPITNFTCLATRGNAPFFSFDEIGLPTTGGVFKCKHAIDWNWEDKVPSNWTIEYLD